MPKNELESGGDLENIIDQLIEDKIIVPGTQIIRNIILHNDTRRVVYNFIKQYPGVNINSIKTSLKLGSNAVLWHIGVLLKFGCVQEFQVKTSVLFALPHLTPTDVMLSVLMRKDLIRRILQLLATQPLTLTQLGVYLGESRHKISHAITKLQEMAIIEKQCQQDSMRSSCYSLHPDLQNLYLQWSKE